MVWCGLVWFGVVWVGVGWCGVVWCGVLGRRRTTAGSPVASDRSAFSPAQRYPGPRGSHSVTARPSGTAREMARPALPRMLRARERTRSRAWAGRGGGSGRRLPQSKRGEGSAARAVAGALTCRPGAAGGPGAGSRCRRRQGMRWSRPAARGRKRGGRPGVRQAGVIGAARWGRRRSARGACQRESPGAARQQQPRSCALPLTTLTARVFTSVWEYVSE